MARFTPTDIATTYASIAALNANFDEIATLLEQCVFRDGTAPNSMNSNFDMNHFRITNLAAPANDSDAARLSDVTDAVSGLQNPSAINFTRVGTATTRTLQTLLEEKINVKDFGAVGDGVTDDTVALQAVATHVNALSTPAVVRFPEGDYSISDVVTFSNDGLIIEGNGATISGAPAGTEQMVTLSGDNIQVKGLRILMKAAGSANAWCFEVTGGNCTMDGITIERENVGDGTTMYIRGAGASGFLLVNSRIINSKNINIIGASDVLIMSSSFEGGTDDAIAVNTTTGVVQRIGVIGCSFKDAASFLALGSFIGAQAADDATYSNRVHGVVLMGNRGIECNRILYIKPGAIDVFDVRDGTVDGVLVSDNILIDETGERFATGISITPARGARVKNVRGRNNVIRARCIGGGVRLVGTVDMYIIDHAGGTTDASISDVDLEISYEDPFEGQTNDVSRPGFPVTDGARVQPANFNIGTFSNIKLSLDINGTSEHGIVIGSAASANLDNAVELKKINLRNINRSATANIGGIAVHNIIKVSDPNAFIQTTSGDPYILQNNGGIVSNVDNVFWTSTIAAGNTDTQQPWVPSKRCYLHTVDLVVSQAVTADDTNYSTYQFRNIGGTGDVFHTLQTKITGNDEANGVKVMGLVAGSSGTVNEILNSKAVTNATNKLQHFFDEDSILQIQKIAEAGTGSALVNARLRFHWAPY